MQNKCLCFNNTTGFRCSPLFALPTVQKKTGRECGRYSSVGSVDNMSSLTFGCLHSLRRLRSDTQQTVQILKGNALALGVCSFRNITCRKSYLSLAGEASSLAASVDVPCYPRMFVAGRGHARRLTRQYPRAKFSPRRWRQSGRNPRAVFYVVFRRRYSPCS